MSFMTPIAAPQTLLIAGLELALGRWRR